MPSSSSHLKNRKNKTIIQSLIDGIKNGDYIYDKFSFTNDKFIIKDLELQTNSFNTDDLTVPTLKTNQIIFNDGNTSAIYKRFLWIIYIRVSKRCSNNEDSIKLLTKYKTLINEI